METGLLDFELKELSSEGIFEGILASYNSIDQDRKSVV